MQVALLSDKHVVPPESLLKEAHPIQPRVHPLPKAPISQRATGCASWFESVLQQLTLRDSEIGKK